MYPATPLSMALDTSLARTGFPIASLLIVGTVLLLAGLFLQRTSRFVASDRR